jgi:hypothetical protein
MSKQSRCLTYWNLFHDAVTNRDDIVSNERTVNNEFERTWTNFNVYFEMLLDKMRKSMKNTNEGSLCPTNIRTR